jgi:hypothetical protein
MIQQLRGFSGSEEDRCRIEAWTRKVFPVRERPDIFSCHGNALSIFDSIWNIRETYGSQGAPVIRVEDVVDYVEELTRGGCATMDMSPWVQLTMSFDELAQRVSRPPTRWWYDGLGWMQSVTFCSVVTGIQYSSFVQFEPPYDRPEGPVFPCVNFQRDADPGEAALELLYTLEIDVSGVAQSTVQFELRWALYRQDDNGNRFEVEKFATESGARARLAFFESMSHKQMYWLEPFES